MSSSMNVCIHVTSHWKENDAADAARQLILIRVINDYLSHWKVNKLDIFIHTNSLKSLDAQKQFILPANITAHYILHDISNEHPQNLAWKSRDLMERQKDLYDVFINIENDIAVPFKAFEYWLKYKDELHANELDVGFLRVETTDDKTYYCSDVLIPSNYPIQVVDRVFVWNHQNYCAFWICDKQELNKFIESVYWKKHCFFPEGPSKPPSGFILESAAIGYKMSYKGSFYPLDGKLVSDICFVHHLSNTYINKEHTPLGKFAVSRMTETLFP